MQGRRYPFIAREGILLVASALLLAIWCWYAGAYRLLPLPLLAGLLLYLLFRDPHRPVPASALGIVSPVDGVVSELETVSSGTLQGEAHRLVIRVDMWGAYTARAPVEGAVKSLASAAADGPADYATNALWIQTDEGEDVVMSFNGFRFGIPPKSFARYGERLGQGQRCAYLRLARYVELHLPVGSRILVEPGQKLTAGSDLLGSVPQS
ncbi:MAG: phosphatidylserine decarboxylase [Pseudomonadota bacterium]